MSEIQFYEKGKNPEELTQTKIDTSRNILDYATEKERQLISESWKRRAQPGWTDGVLGSLQDTTNGLFWIGSNFSVYIALTDPNLKTQFNPTLIERSRSSAGGCAIQTIDGYFIAQRRGYKVANANGRLDSSITAMVNLKTGREDFANRLKTNAKRELGIDPNSILDFRPTGTHKGVDFTTVQITYRGTIPLTLEEVKKLKDPEFTGNTDDIAGLYGKTLEQLPGFLIDNSDELLGGFIDDGLAALMESLPQDTFFEVAKELSKRGRTIRFGDIEEGIFIPDLVLDERLR